MAILRQLAFALRRQRHGADGADGDEGLRVERRRPARLRRMAPAGGGYVPPQRTPQGPDPYAVLGIDRNADERAIKRAYRKLISEHHPDRLGDLPDDMRKRAESRASEINAAYDRIKEDARIQVSARSRTGHRAKRARLSRRRQQLRHRATRHRASSCALHDRPYPGSRHGQAIPDHRPVHPRRRFRAARRGHRRGARRRRRLGAFRRDGQPLRAEPHDRPDGAAGAAQATASPRRSTCT